MLMPRSFSIHNSSLNNGLQRLLGLGLLVLELLELLELLGLVLMLLLLPLFVIWILG